MPKKEILCMKTMRALVWTGFTLVAMAEYAQADRTVHFNPAKSIVHVSNPSSISLTFSMTCHKLDGTVLKSWTSQTLADGTSRSYRLHGHACSASSSVFQTNENIAACMNSSSLTYANATNACGSTHRLCSIEEVSNVELDGTKGNDTFWLLASGTFSTSATGSSWTNAPGTSAPLSASSTRSYCNDASFGAGTSTGMCTALPQTSTANGSLCCPQPVGSCSVTVTGDSGFLVIPDYKGSSAF